MSVKSLRDWLAEGEHLYSEAMAQYNSIESQIEQLEEALASKRNEVNQIAQVIGKPPVENKSRLSAQLVESEPTSVVGTVTRALTGRGLGRA